MSPLQHWTSEPDPASIPDGELVRRVLAGETEAYEGLVLRYQEGLFRYARGLGIAPDPAEDLVQDALVRAYRYLRTCVDPEHFEVWVFRILRNAALDWLKDVRRRSVGTDEVILLHPGPNPEEAAAHAELRSSLRRGVMQLPTDLRDAFLMRHLEGFSYEEMQQITGASQSALKMRVLRARKILRGTMEDRAEPVPM
jgi:RNA polymerase sigma-70 factor (ECF subfamily)